MVKDIGWSPTTARYVSDCPLCGERINQGDPIYPQRGHPARYWICEPCQVNDPERPIDAAFVQRKIRRRLEGPLVNRKSSPYTPRVPEARILGEVGAELYLRTDADVDLREDLKRWGTEGRPRALSWAKTRRLLQWLEQFEECTGVSPPDPETEFLESYRRGLGSQWVWDQADGPPDGGHTGGGSPPKADSR